MQILLQFGVLLCHLLILAFPLVTRSLKRLHLAFVMTSLDVGLAEPIDKNAALVYNPPTLIIRLKCKGGKKNR